jgi:hypothetical protein
MRQQSHAEILRWGFESAEMEYTKAKERGMRDPVVSLFVPDPSRPRKIGVTIEERKETADALEDASAKAADAVRRPPFAAAFTIVISRGAKITVHHSRCPVHAEHGRNYLRTRYVVETAGDENHGLGYSQFGWGAWDHRPPTKEAKWPKHCSIRDVVADLVAHYHDEFPRGYMDAEDRVKYGNGINGLDLAIWRDGRLLAVIRRGPDGEPVPTIFDDPA